MLVGMTFLLCLLSDGRRNEWLGIPSPHPGCHHVPVTMQPKFQQSFLFLFWRYPRFSSRSECRTFQLSAQLATWWCKLRRKLSGFSKRSSWFSFRAMLGSTVDTCSASAPGCFWTFFLRVGGTRLLKSTLSCSSVCGHARRRQRQWYVLPGSWLRCISPCVPFVCCRPGNGEVAQLMLQLLFLPESYFWNRRTRATVWKSPPGVKVVWVGERTEEGGSWYWHWDTRVSAYGIPPLPPE